MEPSKIPFLVEGISEGSWIVFDDQFFAGRGNLLAFTCKNVWDSCWNPQGLCHDLPICFLLLALGVGLMIRGGSNRTSQLGSVLISVAGLLVLLCIGLLPRSGLRSGSMRMTSVRPLEIGRFKKFGPSTMRG